MAIGDIIVGIDIGSCNNRAVVGEVNSLKQIEILADNICKSSGIEKGKIVDENALADSIAECISDVENDLNKVIKSAYITIPSSYITIIQKRVEKTTKDKYSGISQKDLQPVFSQIRNTEIPSD